MRISVCLATYNGELYIEQQLKSLISQIAEDDEIIVFDDNSTDNTRKIILELGDDRIKLHKNDINMGHVKNFERTLADASGDLIFFCDQDDIWLPSKREIILELFQNDPQLMFVHHGFEYVNSSGELIAGKRDLIRTGYQNRLFFLLRQLAQCQIFGCASAFRRELLEILLPFPKFVYAHDHWLAVASCVKGRVYMINMPLILHRIHDKNLTPKKGLSWMARILVRLQLFTLACLALLRRGKIISR